MSLNRVSVYCDTMPRDANTVSCLEVLRTSLDNLSEELFEASTAYKGSGEIAAVAGHTIQLRKAAYTVMKKPKPGQKPDRLSNLRFEIQINYPEPRPELIVHVYVFGPEVGVVRTRNAVRRGIAAFELADDTYYSNDQDA